ncbi:MSC_0623 family F1-like ATPase-associated protein [Mycoplasma leonicaptivi]|uniref:MSC_0623 family F1-like ATPase-associated protein n=1 Tax=Mycoplasma leonicaptivi TaxID=36742 RepID=UPI000686798E|nr:DUF2714 domain-containing protein [Mycoplasma leonicaptivi]
MLKRSNKKNIDIPSQELFDIYNIYKNSKNSNRFISFQKLLTSPLLKSNLTFNSEEIFEFVNGIKKAMDKKYQILFKDFIVSFNLNPMYSLTSLVPIIASEESSNNFSLSVISSENPNLNKFLDLLNFEINELLAQGFYVEVLPNTLLMIKNGKYKIFFDKQLTTKIENKDTTKNAR